MIITKNGVELRNLEEQVQENARLIAEHYNIDRVLADFGIRVIGTLPYPPDRDQLVGTEYGDAYFVGTAEPYSVWVWTRPDINSGHPDDYWLNIGPIAIEGPVGPQGPQGERGPVGQSTKWRSGSATPSTIEGDQEGDLYFRTNGEIYQCVSPTSSGVLVWSYLTSINGPVGPQGPRGFQGETGPQGPQGQKGDTGDVGGFINIRGILTNIDQLPTPASLNNLSVGYLVGATEPYDLYIQVGQTPETAEWTNTGPFNAATLVMVNGSAQNVWSADTKVDKYTPTDGYMYAYAVTSYGAQYMIKVSDAVLGNALARRTVNGQLRARDPVDDYDTVNKRYFNANAVRWNNTAWSNNSIPAKDGNGASTYRSFSTTPGASTIAQRDNYGNLKASNAPVLGTTSTSNPYDGTKVSTMGNMFEHTNFSTQIRKISTSSLTAHKTLSTYGIYEFYIPEGSYIHAGGYPVNGITTNTKLAVSGGILKIVYTPDYMIIEGYSADNIQFESYYVPPTDGSYGKYTVQHGTSQPPLYVKVDIFPPAGKYTLYDIGTNPTYK